MTLDASLEKDVMCCTTRALCLDDDAGRLV